MWTIRARDAMGCELEGAMVINRNFSNITPDQLKVRESFAEDGATVHNPDPDPASRLLNYAEVLRRLS